MGRKKFLPLLAIVLISMLILQNYVLAGNKVKGPFVLPDLPYKYSALSPYIDTKTMKIHHQNHHGTYVENLNEAINKYPELKNKSLEYLLTNLNTLPQDIRESVRNNGGGHYNHSLFWTIMGKSKKSEPEGKLKEDIDKTFGSFENFKKEFKDRGTKRFGSGWVWLIKDDKGKLRIVSTPNQDTPIMVGITPIMGLDVWEHAYYLKYQNKRGEYVDNWWNVVNWDEVEKRYAKY